MKPKILIISIFVISLASNSFFIYKNYPHNKDIPKKEADLFTGISKKIPSGYSFGALLNDLPVSTTTKNLISASLVDIYDTSKLRAGNALSLFFDKDTNELKKLVYNIDTEKNLEIQNINNDQWKSEVIIIPYEKKVETIEGVVDSSVYETLLGLNKDPQLAVLLSEIFAWQVDFAFNVQKGDSFKIIYEARYLNGEYKLPGEILSAKFINNGETFYAYHFKSDKTPEGYYDEKGLSLEKMFLKFPLQYKHISSRYTYQRIDPINGSTGSHRAIDFAASSGTPVVSIGDGVVLNAGWGGGYGNKVVIRHNEMYTTTYGHFSGFSKGIKAGAHVKQGQVIGYVGSTGHSTGPHLHYEVKKFGALINPLSIKPPDGKPINLEDQKSFEEIKNSYIL